MKTFSTSSSTVLAVSVAVLLLVCMADNASALKCYACDSSSSLQCTENYFVGLVNTVVDGCACCRKSVSGGSTTRKCVSGLSTVTDCIPLSNVHICNTDNCNEGSSLRGSNGLIFVLVGSAVVILAQLAGAGGRRQA